MGDESEVKGQGNRIVARPTRNGTNICPFLFAATSSSFSSSTNDERKGHGAKAKKDVVLSNDNVNRFYSKFISRYIIDYVVSALFKRPSDGMDMRTRRFLAALIRWSSRRM